VSVAAVLLLCGACGESTGGSSAPSKAPETTETTATVEPVSLATPAPREPVVLDAEYAPLFRSSPGSFQELYFPLLANTRSVLLELYAKGGDPSDIDFSSVTDEPRVKAELRLMAEDLLTRAQDLVDVKFCLDSGVVDENVEFGDALADTSWWDNCGTFSTVPGLFEGEESVFTLRTVTREDPKSELTKNTTGYSLGSRLTIGDDDTLRFIKEKD
jgi:hypothetical protein